jgi:hypothetical protein
LPAEFLLRVAYRQHIDEFGDCPSKPDQTKFSAYGRSPRLGYPPKSDRTIPAIPVGSTVLNLAAALSAVGRALGAIDAGCGTPQRSSQINVDQDELNLVLPEAITSVAQGDSSSSVVAENYTREFAWQTITRSYRVTMLEARISLFGREKAVHPAA